MPLSTAATVSLTEFHVSIADNDSLHVRTIESRNRSIHAVGGHRSGGAVFQMPSGRVDKFPRAAGFRQFPDCRPPRRRNLLPTNVSTSLASVSASRNVCERCLSNSYRLRFPPGMIRRGRRRRTAAPARCRKTLNRKHRPSNARRTQFVLALRGSPFRFHTEHKFQTRRTRVAGNRARGENRHDTAEVRFDDRAVFPLRALERSS